jgi:hypothetical protein
MPQRSTLPPAPGLGRQIGSEIEGMAGPAAGGDAETEAGASAALGCPPVLKQGQHGEVPITPAPMVAPAQPQRRTRVGRQPHADPVLGLAPHRISAPPQRRRAGTDAGKQVEHLQSSVAPGPGEALQPPEGGVVALPIGPGGIEADKNQPRPLRCPPPLQPPAVVAAGAEGGIPPASTSRGSFQRLDQSVGHGSQVGADLVQSKSGLVSGLNSVRLGCVATLKRTEAMDRLEPCQSR